MADSNFYNNFGPFKLKEIVDENECELIGNDNLYIYDVSTINAAKVNEISFVSNKKYLKEIEDSRAGVLVIERKYIKNKNKNYLISENPYYLFAKIVQKFYPESIYPNSYFTKKDKNVNLNKSIKVSENTFVHKKSKIGSNSTIGLNSVIGPGVKIGENCIIADNVSIFYSIIGDNCKVFSGSRIGGEGFGFAINKKDFIKIPQIGRVIISENVEIGSNCTIDRGSCGDTLIKKNCMIDNMVHVAHNVRIGEGSVIAGMTGISGSTQIGKHAMIGGQVGFSGHLKIGDNVKIAAGSGVIKDIESNKSVGGYPAVSLNDWHRNTIFLKKNAKYI